jgi:hypothetical protein
VPSNRESLAWAAGLFEGEGSFRYQKNKNGARRLVGQLSMTDESVVRNFHSTVGVGRVYGPFQKKNPKRKPHWMWSTTTFEEAQFVAASLWFRLDARRRQQIKSSFASYYGHPAQTRRWFKMPDDRLTPENVREIRERVAAGETQAAVARIFKRSQGTISKIISRDRQENVQ